MRTATKRTCTASVQAPESVQFEAHTPAERFSATIIHLPAKTVARLAEASVDTVNSWRTGRRFPQWEYLRRLQRHIPAVRSFVAREFGFSENILVGLQQLANDSTHEAAQARAVLRDLMRAD